MSANLKTTALETSGQKKTTSLALVSKKKSRQPDPLKLYKRDAQQIISLLYEQDTPDFVTDLLQDFLTELESHTQVFWNRREILEVALPLMFQEADDMGIDYLSSKSSVMRDAISANHGRDEDVRPLPREYTEREELVREIEADAEALARVINSPRVPQHIRESLGQHYLTFTENDSEAPESVRTMWTIAALRFCAEQSSDQ